jgi:proteasome lid subunit RPN8/RPN11
MPPFRKSPTDNFQVYIHPSTHKHMLTHLSLEAPKEGCGVLFQRERLVVRFLPIPNIHPQPLTNFDMHGEIFATLVPETVHKGYQLAAFVHSHPGRNRDATPSRYDISSHAILGLPDLPNIIVAWHQGNLTKPFAVAWKYPSTSGRLVQSQVGSKLT